MTDASDRPAPTPDVGSVLAAPEPAARPYGLLGLVLSTAAILLVAAFVCGLLALAVFGGAVLTLGFRAAIDRFVNLDPTGGSDPLALMRLNIVAGLAIYVVVSGVVLAAARFKAGRGWRALVAWRPWHPFRGATLFWVLLGATLIYSIGADRLVTDLHPEAKDWTPQPSGAFWDILFVALAALLAPLTEELLFRGWIYTSLRAAIGIPAGILLSAALFALAHWESTHLYALAIFPVGLALGVVRERSGSIAASIAFHALYNGFASALLLSR